MFELQEPFKGRLIVEWMNAVANAENEWLVGS